MRRAADAERQAIEESQTQRMRARRQAVRDADENEATFQADADALDELGSADVTAVVIGRDIVENMSSLARYEWGDALELKTDGPPTAEELGIVEFGEDYAVGLPARGTAVFMQPSAFDYSTVVSFSRLNLSHMGLYSRVQMAAVLVAADDGTTLTEVVPVRNMSNTNRADDVWYKIELVRPQRREVEGFRHVSEWPPAPPPSSKIQYTSEDIQAMPSAFGAVMDNQGIEVKSNDAPELASFAGVVLDSDGGSMDIPPGAFLMTGPPDVLEEILSRMSIAKAWELAKANMKDNYPHHNRKRGRHSYFTIFSGDWKRSAIFMLPRNWYQTSPDIVAVPVTGQEWTGVEFDRSEKGEVIADISRKPSEFKNLLSSRRRLQNTRKSKREAKAEEKRGDARRAAQQLKRESRRDAVLKARREAQRKAAPRPDNLSEPEPEPEQEPAPEPPKKVKKAKAKAKAKPKPKKAKPKAKPKTKPKAKPKAKPKKAKKAKKAEAAAPDDEKEAGPDAAKAEEAERTLLAAQLKREKAATRAAVAEAEKDGPISRKERNRIISRVRVEIQSTYPRVRRAAAMNKTRKTLISKLSAKKASKCDRFKNLHRMKKAELLKLLMKE